LILFLVLLIDGHLLGDAPGVLLLEEDTSVLHVIETVHVALRAHERFRIANVRAQVCRHLVRIAEEAGKRRAVRSNQRILGIEHVEVRRAVIRVNYDLHAVTNVIDAVAFDLVVTGVRVIGRFGVSVHDPE